MEFGAQRIIITGPTASGKGTLAAELARRLQGEIVSVDSMKIYRGMDVGTAKPPPEWRREIPYHLLDIVDPWEDFSAGRFLPLALEATRDAENRGRRVVFQGGTALYLKTLLDGIFRGPEADWSLRQDLRRRAEERGLESLHRELREADPEVAQMIHPHDERRIVRALEVLYRSGRKMSEQWLDSSVRLEPGSYRIFGVEWARSEIYHRIDRRVEEMVKKGLAEETRSLLENPRGLSRSASKCLGYRHLIEGWQRGEPIEAIVRRIQRDTRHFAKQQLTWFRRFPITWLPVATPAALAQRILDEVGL